MCVCVCVCVCVCDYANSDVITSVWANHRGIGGEAAPGKAITSVLNMHN